MKKLSLKSLIAVALLVLAMAVPETAKAQLRYGITLGGDFNSSKLSGEYADDYNLKTGSGFRGGLTLEYQMLTCGLAFDASVLYNRVNVRSTIFCNDSYIYIGDKNESTKAMPYRSMGRNFLEIPLNIKYKFGIAALNNLFSPMILTGPSFMINLDKSDKNPYLEQRRFQPAWNVGAGIDVVNFIQLSAGYRFPLGNALKENDYQWGVKIRNQGWWLQATMLFDF